MSRTSNLSFLSDSINDYLRTVARFNNWYPSTHKSGDFIDRQYDRIHFLALSKQEVVNHNPDEEGEVIYTFQKLRLILSPLMGTDFYALTTFSINLAVPSLTNDQTGRFFLNWHGKKLPSDKQLETIRKEQGELWIVTKPISLDTMFRAYDYYALLNKQLPVFNFPKV